VLLFVLSGTSMRVKTVRAFRNQNSCLSEPKFVPFGTIHRVKALVLKAFWHP